MTFISPTKHNCDKCGKSMPAFYTLSFITQGLWIQCTKCGTHTATYVRGLNLYLKPSSTYKRTLSTWDKEAGNKPQPWQERLF